MNEYVEARRYRFLRDDFAGKCTISGNVYRTPEELDAAIDALLPAEPRCPACGEVALDPHACKSAVVRDALTRAKAGLNAALQMCDRGGQPTKLDAALTWRANDELARSMVADALVAIDALLESGRAP